MSSSSSPLFEADSVRWKHFSRVATAFLIVLFLGFMYYRLSGTAFRDDLNVPKWKLGGLDFRAYHVFATDLLDGISPYSHDTSAGPNPYPPLYTIFVAPFAMMQPDTAFLVWSAFSIVAFVATVRMAMQLGQTPTKHIAIWAVAVYALSQTYPIPFVWERGTPEFFILFFMALGLMMLLRGNFWAAIPLLTVATHFKLYPLILGAFVLLRGGFRWAIGFAVAVGATFFVLGLSTAKDFYRIITWTMQEPARWIWTGNHSLKSFQLWLENNGYIAAGSGSAVVVMVGVVLVLVFCWLLWEIYRRRQNRGPFSAAEANLLGMAFSLMTLLPTFSHDYKLAQAFFPLLVLMSNAQAAQLSERSKVYRVLLYILGGLVAVLFLPRFGEVPKTPVLVLVFGVYAALAEISLRTAVSTAPDVTRKPAVVKV